MKKIVTNSILVLLLTATFYIGMCWTINHVQLSGKRAACWINPQFQRRGGQEYRLAQDWDTNAKYDVVVVGSSHAYRGYDPREFEKRGYNMFTIGSGFQNTLASYVFITDVFRPKENSLVIIDLFDQTFIGDGMGCFTRVMENLEDDHAANDLLARSPDLRLFNSYMCRMFSRHIGPEIPDEPGYLVNGYCPKDDTLKKLPAEITIMDDLRFDTRYIHYLDKMIAYLKRNNVKVVLVSHPQPRLISYAIYHSKFVEQVKPVIQKHNVVYLDYNNEHSLDNLVHFADANHLNQSGVELFNGELIARLIDLNYLERAEH